MFVCLYFDVYKACVSIFYIKSLYYVTYVNIIDLYLICYESRRRLCNGVYSVDRTIQFVLCNRPTHQHTKLIYLYNN